MAIVIFIPFLLLGLICGFFLSVKRVFWIAVALFITLEGVAYLDYSSIPMTPENSTAAIVLILPLFAFIPFVVGLALSTLFKKKKGEQKSRA